jgi:2-polyprenyl-6-methoxyphenol hydroxylase-like FAD-dependent oxidoreductase
MNDCPAQVVIVGGGPVGMGLAIELGQRNIHCVVVERYDQPQPIPKGQNLTQRTLEHFHFWGVEREVRAARTIPPEYGIGGLTAYGTLLGGYHYDWMQRELVRPFYFADNERLPQYATERALRRRAAELPSVQALYGWSAQELHQDDAGVDVVIAERDGAGRRTLRADYVVGCDGSRSVTRAQAGITQSLSDHDRLMVLLVFRSHELHRLLQRYPGKSFYSVLHPELEGYWKFFGRVDLGSTWFFHAPVPPGTTRDNFDFQGLVHAAAGAEFDIEFEHVGFWELRFAVADTYRQGRIFIAGDAAHGHPPYGGYGINTGFEDARNLGWKLTAALQGWAGEGLLDAYDAERRPVFQSTARDFIEKAIAADRAFLAAFDPERDREAFEHEWGLRKSGARSEVNAFEPNYEGSPIVCGPPDARCSAVGSHAFAARAGHHLAPQPLSSGRNVYEELGDGFTLLALDGDDTLCRAFEAVAEAMHLPLKIIRDSRTGGRERYEAAHILIRPDQFVAWARNDGAVDASAVLRKAIGGSC